jgi:hypothetical protein
MYPTAVSLSYLLKEEEPATETLALQEKKERTGEVQKIHQFKMSTPCAVKFIKG